MMLCLVHTELPYMLFVDNLFFWDHLPTCEDLSACVDRACKHSDTMFLDADHINFPGQYTNRF